MGISVFLLVSVALANSSCITLSLNETAVIDPSEYFSGDIAGIEIKSVGEHKAAVVKPHNATEIFRMETEDSGSFGPSVQVNDVHFFTVLYPGKLEVWKANGHSINRVWGVTATVGKVVPLQMNEATGFVYWTQPDMELFFLDLNSPALSVQSIPGIDTTSASLIAVCLQAYSIITVQSPPRTIVLTHYQVDYASMTAERVKTTSRVLEDQPYDALCTTDLLLLTPTSLLLFGREETVESISIPVSFGLTRFQYLPDSQRGWYLRASNSASIIVTADALLMLPGVLRILHWTDAEVRIESVGFQLVLTRRDDRLATRKHIVPLHQVLRGTDDLLWLSSAYHQSALLLIKRDQLIVGVRVDSSESILTVSSHPFPYSFDLCATDFEQKPTCASITVITHYNKPGDIFLTKCSGDQSTLTIRIPLSGRKALKVLFLSHFICGWNWRGNVTFPNLPVYLTSYVSDNLFDYEKTERRKEKVDIEQFLCAKQVDRGTNFLMLKGDQVIERLNHWSSVLFHTNLSIVSCVFIRESFYVFYAENEEEGFLLVWEKSSLEQYSLKSKGYISMLESDSRVMILTQKGVQVMGIASTQLQWIEGQFAGMWAGLGKLVLRTTEFLDLYELWGDTYTSRSQLVVPADISQFAVSNQVFFLLHSNSILSVYHLFAYSQLIFKFSVVLDCTVSYLIANEHIAAYRCLTHIQVLNTNEKVHSLLGKQIALDSMNIWKEVDSDSVYEVYRKKDSWQLVQFRLGMYSDNIASLQFHIADDYLLSGPVAFQGQLAVANVHSRKEFTVNITMENHGEIIVPSLDSVEKDQIQSSLTVEIPSGGQLTMSSLDLFQGKEMNISTESHTGFTRTKVHGAIEPQGYLVFPRTYKAVTLAPEARLLFAVDSVALIADDYECSGELCEVTSKHSISLSDIDLQTATMLEFIVAVGQYAFVRVLEARKNSLGLTISSEVIVCYDIEKSVFAVVFRQPLLSVARDFYVIPGNTPNTFHLLLYSTVLKHCTAHAEAQMNCTEVAEPGLVQVESVGGVKVSEACWHVYAVTRLLRLYTLLLCEKLSVLSFSSIKVGIGSTLLSTAVIGSRLLVNTEDLFFIYSLPDLSLLTSEPLCAAAVGCKQVVESGE